MSLFSAKVKSALSGDTVILSPLNNSTAERQLSLAFVSAPRLSANELYGFESRELLRSLLVGKQIQFKVLYTINGREYGDLIAPVFPSLIEKALRQGSVKLRDDASTKESYDEQYQQKLENAQNDAESSATGVWSTSNITIEVESVIPDTIKLGTSSELYNAIVERVISGDRLQVRVILKQKPQVHFVGVVLVAGIRAPRSAGAETAAEPFGEASKQFVAVRLLQRSVKVQFVDKSSTGVPIANVVHPVGDISDFLLKAGLATVSDWHGQFLGAQRMSALRAAESAAKSQNLNLWKDTAASGAKNLKSYEAVISRVVSPDTYVVALQNGDEVTVQLASIRSPRKNDSSQEPFVVAAKEFARSKFIGKKVHVDLVAIRPKSEQFEERELVTITLQDKNITLTLVESGYASVIRHRKDDTDRSPIWDELIEKEGEALAANKGMYSKKKPSAGRTIDASENLVKAKGFLTSLQRQGKVTGVVDYISSGGRFRIVVPRENCILTLVLGGIRVPRPQEEGGEAALKYVSKRLWQRDVSFSVLNTDKTGGFVGHLYLPSSNTPVSVALVKEGLAEVHEFSAQNSGFADELFDAEEEAKKQKKGLWKNYVEEAPVEEKPAVVESANITSDTGSKKYIDVIISDVSSQGQLSYRSKSSDAAFQKVSAELASYNTAAANSAQFALQGTPRRGQLVTYVSGNKYFRARIVSHEKDTFEVLLIDTGADKKVPSSSLRQLPAQFQSQAPAASAAELSFVEIPSLPEYVEDYVAYFEGKDIVGKKLAASVDFNGPPSSLTLFTADSTGPDDSINSSLIYNGYAFVQQKLPAWARGPAFSKTLANIKDLEDDCRKNHHGIWEYGDPRDDE